MSNFARIGSTNYPSVTAALAALQDAPNQLVEILRSGQGAEAFGTVTPGINGEVTISGVIQPDGSLPELQALGTFVRLAWGKAIINIEKAKKVTVQNLILSNAAVTRDSNGAGIRINQDCEEAHIKNVIARNCENGILAKAGKLVVVEDCLMDNCGQSNVVAREGYSHGLYIEADGTLEITRSTIQNSEHGHDGKTRSKRTVVRQSRLIGSKRGRALDVSDGGIWDSEDSEYIKHALPDNKGQNNLIHLKPEAYTPDGRPEKYTSVNDLFSIDMPYGRALQYIKNDGSVECVLTDPKFIQQGVEISDEDARKMLIGDIRIVLTGGPRGPRKRVGRAEDAKAAPAPAPAPTEPVPTTPVPTPPVLPPTPAINTWTKVGAENGSITVPDNTTVRYGANGQWVTKVVSGQFTATNAFFGSDPVPGTAKIVEKLESSVTSAPTPVPVPVPTPSPVMDATANMAVFAGLVAYFNAMGYTVIKK